NDPVTGLLNLGRFRTQMDVEVKRTRRHGRPLCAAVLDIDGFRAVNTQHGYALGDEVLTAAGHALGAGMRAHDLACRAGADEFVILLPETDVAGAETGMERVLHELENTHVGPLESIQASIGVAEFDRAHTAAQLLAAALLHDIGKVAIPDEILNKPSALTEEQWKLMRDHTVIGERILRAIPGLGHVARVVRHEHERWDGGGYPDGLAGEDIPIG